MSNPECAVSISKRFFALAAAVFVFSFSPTVAFALPEHTSETYYYSGCGANFEEIGGYVIDCEGHHTYWGNGGGAKWMMYRQESCSNCGGEFCHPEDNGSHYYEWCPSTGWKLVSESDFLNANCSC
jgi:hypothetical protein